MQKEKSITLVKPSGEERECPISKSKPAFRYFQIVDEYRFNTVLLCMEKKVNGKWVESQEWDWIRVGEEIFFNPLWTNTRRELARSTLFLSDKRKITFLYGIVLGLMSKRDESRYRKAREEAIKE